ncbi:hypothetical protein BJX99DRAFT_229954 [Aspergillus californicus]
MHPSSLTSRLLKFGLTCWFDLDCTSYRTVYREEVAEFTYLLYTHFCTPISTYVTGGILYRQGYKTVGY